MPGLGAITRSGQMQAWISVTCFFQISLAYQYHPAKFGAGLAWVRMITDLPTAYNALRAGDVDLKCYVRSLRQCTTEAVFSAKDPLPGLAEILFLPYLAYKKGL